MSTNRRKYGSEFKLEAVELAATSGKNHSYSQMEGKTNGVQMKESKEREES